MSDARSSTIGGTESGRHSVQSDVGANWLGPWGAAEHGTRGLSKESK